MLHPPQVLGSEGQAEDPPPVWMSEVLASCCWRNFWKKQPEETLSDPRVGFSKPALLSAERSLAHGLHFALFRNTFIRNILPIEAKTKEIKE